ncbi:MAG TPA: hypothetical protein VFQ53_31280 [Kofleriaceae bacterium]|nr:hypothetical protein [Kofleriaceae bacterium]
MMRSWLWVIVAASGCGRDADGGPTKPLPPALVGEWKFEQLGDVQCDAAGKCHPTIARRERMKLAADGAFEYSLYAESHFPPCKLVGHAQGKGTATATATTLALHVREGFVKREDSCGKSAETNEKGQIWKYTYELARDGTLMLTNDEGTKVGPYKKS